MIKSPLYIIVLIILFSSCVTSKRVNYLQDLRKEMPASTQLDSIAYQLKAGDRVSVIVSMLDQELENPFSMGSGAEEMSDLSSYKVLSDGTIDLPYVGSIKLLGLTLRQARDTVMNYILPVVPSCDVDVKLVNTYFSIIGAGGAGRYEITKGRINVFDALILSGDLSSFSDKSKIFILRQNLEGKTEIKNFDIRNKKIFDSEYYYIYPNDVIYVQSFNGQFFGIQSFSSLFSTVSSGLSFLYLMYNYIP